MRHRDLKLNLQAASGETLVARIISAVEQAIREGRLKSGDALPGSRALADSLGVNRNTVIAALGDLEAQGWLVSEPNRGTFVANRTPSRGEANPTERAAALGFDLPSQLSPISAVVPGALNLADGLADSRLAPTEEMAKAYQRALRRHGQDLLQYGEPHGNKLFREAIAGWVSERHGVRVEPDQILVTRGGRMALTLIATALLHPGDCVGVESPGNRGAWETLRKAGKAELHPLSVDEEGVSLASLQQRLAQGPLRMLYLTPRCQFPTTVGMSPARAKAVLALAAQHRIAIFEDDYDAEIQYGEQQAMPLYAQDSTGQVIFSASLSRVLAPGLRLGYLIVPPALVGPLARLRRDLEAQGDRVLEWAVADLIRDGELGRHVRRVRKVYQERRDLMAHHLRQEFGGALQISLPKAGLALWTSMASSSSVGAMVREIKELGLVLNPPEHFFMNGPEPCLRIGFAQVNDQEIREACRRLRAGLEASR